jgi:hypothetical protein
MKEFRIVSSTIQVLLYFLERGINNMYIMKMVSVIVIGLLFTGCSNVHQPENIDEETIYPEANIESAKIFDLSNCETKIDLTQNDIDFIIKTIKISDKELVQSYESGMYQLNAAFSDSTIQLLQKDNKTVYYVFHNPSYNGICYKVQSEALSEFINKLYGKHRRCF